MFARTNQINVVGDEDVLLYGRVVDVAENGLYIDLLCPLLRRELIPFHCVFRSERCLPAEFYWACNPPQEMSLTVEVLRREYPGGAWRWWPAEMLNPTSASFPREDATHSVAIVRGREDSGATWTELFPLHRLRWPVPSSWWAGRREKQPGERCVTLPQDIAAGRFFKRCLPLPADCAVVKAAQLRALMKEMDWQRVRYGEVVWVEVVEGQLKYIMELDGGDTLEHFADTVQVILKPFHDALIRRLPGMFCAMTAAVGEAGADEWRAVTSNVWLEVFAHLDTTTQTKLRVVCSAWNALLDEPILTANIVIDASAARSSDNPETFGFHYGLTAPIWKRMNQSTKHLIIHDGGEQFCMRDLSAVADVMCYAAQANPDVHLTALFIVGGRSVLPQLGSGLSWFWRMARGKQCKLHAADDPRMYDAEYLAFLAITYYLPRDALHLVRSTLPRPYCLRSQTDPDLQRDVRLAHLRLPISEDWPSTVWEAIEVALPGLEDGEMQELAEWLTVAEIYRRGG
ncbi:uncharacterized protein LOC129580884 [Paramacrobiotus metropolitanus]|uniref:uncharacterized protein LOC129580884 n=1 Tax=Paramacrobiotus metropolitanus TaxID=2943436 RepID=UPI0024457D1A|nr:uncharacterized protein LOC129580884 [Paramacrobiotus metropolitanus]